MNKEKIKEHGLEYILLNDKEDEFGKLTMIGVMI
jgi:hypothetical protein